MTGERELRSDADRAFDVLLKDYEMLREEQTNSQAVMIALVVSGSAIFAAVLAGLQSSKPYWPLVMLPLLPTFNLGWLLFVMASTIVKDFYLRAIERELHRRSGGPTLNLASGTGRFGDAGEADSLPIPSFTHLAHIAANPQRGPDVIRKVGHGGYYVYLALWVATIIFALSRSNNWLVTMLAAGAYAWLVVIVIRGTYHMLTAGDDLWEETLESMPDGWRRPLDLLGIRRRRRKLDPFANYELTTSRSLASYLLIPRPIEFLNKTLVIGPVTACLGVLLAPGSDSFIEKLQDRGPIGLLTLAVWELCIYQGRYQVNDVLGAEEDAVLRTREARGRLPLLLARTDEPGGENASPWERARAEHNTRRKHLSMAVAIGRLLSAAVWLYLVHIPGRLEIAVIWAGMLILAGAYDTLRADTHRDVGGCPATVTDPLGRDWKVGGILVLIGAGYAARTVMALGIGSTWTLSLGSLFATGLFMWVVGMMGVQMAWVLHATQYLPRGTQLPATEADPILWTRPHVLVLARSQRLVNAATAFRPLIGEDASADLKLSAAGLRQGYWAAFAIIGCALGGLASHIVSSSSQHLPVDGRSALCAAGIAGYVSIPAILTRLLGAPGADVRPFLLIGGWIATAAAVVASLAGLWWLVQSGQALGWCLALTISVTLGSYLLYSDSTDRAISGVDIVPAVRNLVTRMRDGAKALTDEFR